MTALAGRLSAALAGSTTDLVVLDRETNTWRRHPWTEVYARAQHVAARILDDGRTGPIGITAESSLEVVAVIFGTVLAGSPVSILPGPVRGASLPQWAESTMNRFTGIGVRTVFSHGAELDALRDYGTDVDVLDVGMAADHRIGSVTHALPGCDGASIAILQGTAGSTGIPRTVALSSQAVCNNIDGLRDRLHIDGTTDIGCGWLPLYHDMGLACLLSAAVTGMTMWLAPTTAFAASPFRWLDWLSQSGATFIAGPNFAYQVIGKYARRVSDVDLGNVRIAINGGEPVDCEGLELFTKAMAPFGFRPEALSPAYGLAESTCAVTMSAGGTGLIVDEQAGPTGIERRAVLGTPIPGMEMRVVALDTVDGDVGEIQIRGTSMMDGYLGHSPLEPETWFPTGDLGYLTDRGLVVCGRAKEVISIAGRNIFPTEVEQVAAQVPGVRQGAVVAVGGRTASATQSLLVAAEYRGADRSGARAEVIQRIASTCGVVPASVVLFAPGSLPRTSSGKLRRLEAAQLLDSAGA